MEAQEEQGHDAINAGLREGGGGEGRPTHTHTHTHQAGPGRATAGVASESRDAGGEQHDDDEVVHREDAETFFHASTSFTPPHPPTGMNVERVCVRA